MIITFFTYGHETGSSYLMCEDMATIYRERGHECSVTTKVGSITHSDLVVVNHPKEINAVKKLRRFVRIDNIVILFSPWPEGYSKEELANMLVAAHDTPMICHSESLHALVKKYMKELFAPALLRRILGNLHYVPFGILPTFTDESTNSPDKFIAPFNRCEKGKGFDTHSKATQVVKKHLPDTEHHLFLADISLSREDRFDTSMYHTCPQEETREGFQQRLREMGIFISTSTGESFGLYYLELLMSGVVGVFLDAPWVHSLLPGYKLVAPMGELPAMAESVHHDYDKAKKYIQTKVQPYIREHYSLDRFCKQLMEIAHD